MEAGVFSRSLCLAPHMYGDDFSREFSFFQLIEPFIQASDDADELSDLQFRADELFFEFIHLFYLPSVLVRCGGSGPRRMVSAKIIRPTQLALRLADVMPPVDMGGSPPFIS